MGRQSEFSQATADAICERMANGESLRQICKDDAMPGQSTVFKWLLKPEDAAFVEQYARARALLLQYWEDEQLEIADDGSNDWIRRESEEGRVTVTHDYEHWRRSVLRIDTRKWLMSKLLPKKYGERVDLTHANPDGSAIVIQIVKFGELAKATTSANESDPSSP